MRMCVGCKVMKPKKELVRVVRSPDGTDIGIDDKGKKPGRGAYLCADSTCLAKAKKIRALERTFECEIPLEVYETLTLQLQESGAGNG